MKRLITILVAISIFALSLTTIPSLAEAKKKGKVGKSKKVEQTIEKSVEKPYEKAVKTKTKK